MPRISSGITMPSATVSSPKKNTHEETAEFQASAVLVLAFQVVESSAPPFGMLVCSMNRVFS